MTKSEYIQEVETLNNWENNYLPKYLNKITKAQLINKIKN